MSAAIPKAVTTPGRYLKEVPMGSYVHVEQLPGSRNAAKSAVSRAAARGELIPLRRGLYYKGKPTRYGVAKPPPEDVALEVLGRDGVGPTGVSAARALNLTTQVPAVPELTTPGPVPEGLPGVKVHKRNNVARRDLNYFEVAVLELLRNYEFTGETDWPGIVRAVADKARTREVRLDCLAKVGENEPGYAFRGRLMGLIGELSTSESTGLRTAQA
jgi:hypothetical protein